MTTKAAFEQLIKQRGFYALSGMNPDTARQLRVNHKKGLVTNDKMVRVLLDAGYKKIQDVKWVKK